jgi:hypothetical protein
VKTAGAILIAAVMLLSSGCVTRPDWIEATLVTVDVNGVWQGRETSRGIGRPVTFELHQKEGPNVTGTVRFQGFDPGRRGAC